MIMILSMVFSGGCWDYSEYEHLALLSSLGVDFDNSTKQVTVTVEYMITGSATQQGTGGGGSSAKANSEAIRASGTTIAEALSKIQQTTRKRLFYSYLGVVVIGENAAKYMMEDIIEFIDRTPEIRTSTYLTITAGKAEDVLSTVNPRAFVATGKIIHDLIDQSVNSGSAFPVTIEAFEVNLSVSGKSGTAPRVAVISAGNSDNAGSSGGSSSSSGNSSSSAGSGSSSSNTTGQEPYKYIQSKDGYQIIDGLAAFRGDKFIGWLEGKECVGFGWIMNKNMTPYEDVQLENTDDSKETLSFIISKTNSKIRVQFYNGRPGITIDTYVKADLRKDADGAGQTVFTPEVISSMEKELSKSIKADIQSAVNKGQKEFKTDIFSFGFDFYRQYPELWHRTYEKEWNTIFPDIPININVTAAVTNTGTNIKEFAVR